MKYEVEYAEHGSNRWVPKLETNSLNEAIWEFNNLVRIGYRYVRLVEDGVVKSYKDWGLKV